jgi:hypothetical protein
MDAHRDTLAYLVGLISYLPLIREDSMKPDGYVILNAEILKINVGSEYRRRYLNALITGGILETDGTYIKGSQSFGFRFTAPFAKQKLARYQFTSLKWRKHFLQRAEEGNQAKKKYRYLWKWFNSNLTIDESAALSLIETENMSMANAHHIDGIVQQNWRFTVDSTGNRLHTNFTNMNRDFRSFLRYENERLVEIDIVSSQPYFSIILINKYIDSTYGSEVLERFKAAHLPSTDNWFRFLTEYRLTDVAEYVSLIGTGIFYETFFSDMKPFLKNWLPKNSDRKKAFYLVIFGPTYMNTPARQAVRREYPRTLEILDSFKKEAYQDLSIQLQKMEANAILDNVCKRIGRELRNAPIFTIHDSVLTTPPFVDRVTHILREELTRIVGMPPKIRVKT